MTPKSPKAKPPTEPGRTMLDAEHAKNAVAYLVACFPSTGAFFSEVSRDALRKRLVGRDTGDVMRSIDVHAERAESISIKEVLEGIAEARTERHRAEEERNRLSRLRLPAPPEAPLSHRKKVVLAARGVYALTVLGLTDPPPPEGRGRHVMTTREADEHFAVLMSEEPGQLASYINTLETELHHRGKGTTFGDMVNGLGEVVRP